MLIVQDTKRNCSRPVRFARATIMVLALVGAGFVMSTQPESAVGSSKAGNSTVAQAGQENLEPSVYFPAQYVNQGKTSGEPIQAF
jgi:hypothetical protein